MTLAVLTPTYRDDAASFRLLHRSVLERTDPGVVHIAVVPDRDLPLFADLRSPRLRLIPYSRLLPPYFVATDGFARAVARIPGLPRGARFIAVNRRHPLPPLRGWLLQQIVKLAAARAAEADVLVLADSDMQLIAPLTEQLFRHGDSVRYYRQPLAITSGMVRHARWHAAARALLGLPEDGPPPYDDPIAGLLAWDPRVVTGCTDRVSEVAGLPWEDAIARRWEFSEYVLYGEYLRELGRPEDRAFVSDRSLCLNHWSTDPLGEDDVAGFVASRRPDDVAVRIQSTSGTSPRVRERILAELTRPSDAGAVPPLPADPAENRPA